MRVLRTFHSLRRDKEVKLGILPLYLAKCPREARETLVSAPDTLQVHRLRWARGVSTVSTALETLVSALDTLQVPRLRWARGVSTVSTAPPGTVVLPCVPEAVTDNDGRKTATK